MDDYRPGLSRSVYSMLQGLSPENLLIVLTNALVDCFEFEMMETGCWDDEAPQFNSEPLGWCSQRLKDWKVGRRSGMFTALEEG